MLWVFVFTLGVSLVQCRVSGGRSFLPRRAQSDDPFSLTRIGIEILGESLLNVFLKGGFTNGSDSACTQGASIDPCSIPIQHVPHENATNSYLHWAEGDEYLDFYGPELNQNSHNGKLALGTPTFSMLGASALELLNSRHRSTLRQKRFFWYVELKMDCSDSDGFFELAVDSENLHDNRRRDPGNRSAARSPTKRARAKTQVHINFPKSFDFAKLDNHRESQRTDPLPDLKIFNSSAVEAARDRNQPPDGREKSRSPGSQSTSVSAPRITSWRANMDTVSGPEAKPFQIDPIRVTDPALRSHFPAPTSTCYGNVAFTAPYKLDDRFIGLCGHANIFRYNSNFCEINELPS